MKFKLNISFLAWTLLLLPIYKVGYIRELPIVELLFDLGRYVSIIVCILLGLKYIKSFAKERGLLLLFFAKLVIVLLTITMNVVNNDCLYSFILVLLQGIFITYMLKKDKERALSVLNLVFEIIVYINFILLILHPEGLYNFDSERIFTFVGHANNTVYFTLPLLVISLVRYVSGSNKYRFITDSIVCISSTVLVKSSTGIVVYLIFFVMLLIENSKLKIIKRKYFTIFIIILLLSCGIVFFNIQKYFAVFIQVLLHRELDFTGRTFYWNRHINMILDSPFWGHGNVPGNLRWGGLTAHNFILETLYEGGIILLGIFMMFFYQVSQKLDKYRGDKKTRIIFSSIVAISITCLSESNISNDVFFVLFILGLNVDKIITNVNVQ